MTSNWWLKRSLLVESGYQCSDAYSIPTFDDKSPQKPSGARLRARVDPPLPWFRHVAEMGGCAIQWDKEPTTNHSGQNSETMIFIDIWGCLKLAKPQHLQFSCTDMMIKHGNLGFLFFLRPPDFENIHSSKLT